jgi:GNAT superfamily N-acetyltransferase
MTVEPRPTRLIRSEPILAVSDVVATTRYYRDVLGFGDEWTWGEPPEFGGARWDKVSVMFCLQPELASRVEGHQHAILVDGVDALHEQHRASGAQILSALEAKPWGLREYTVRDINGYHLRFAESGSDRPSRVHEDHASAVIDERKPTVEEYVSLLNAVGWSGGGDRVAALVLANALHGVVAVESDRVVGAGLVVGDGATFFYLKDIIVAPACQRRGVGAAVVEALMKYVRRTASKGALVGLFTGRQLADFYERFGFLGPDDGIHGMCLYIHDERPAES